MAVISRKRPGSRFAMFLGIGLWLISLAIGTTSLMRWEGTPGTSGVWAGGAPSKVRAWRILMIAHTECPCTISSLEELKRIIAQAPVGLDATVVFTGPGATAACTAHNIEAARAIPRLRLEFCSEADAVNKYHAHVSGQTFLFSPEGQVRFSGGLTSIRGEAIASSGVAAIGRILNGSHEDAEAPVLGCSLETR